MRMKIGAIYVNGWASARNPQAAGVYIGRAERLHTDGSRSCILATKVASPSGVIRLSPLVLAIDQWDFEDLRAACQRAVETIHADAEAYVSEVLRPLEFDVEARVRVRDGKSVPPSFGEWRAARCA